MCQTQRNDSRWWNGLETISLRWNVVYKQWRLFYCAFLSSTCLSSCECAYKWGTCQSINLEMCAPNDKTSQGLQTIGSTYQLTRPPAGKTACVFCLLDKRQTSKYGPSEMGNSGGKWFGCMVKWRLAFEWREGQLCESSKHGDQTWPPKSTRGLFDP